MRTYTLKGLQDSMVLEYQHIFIMFEFRTPGRLVDGDLELLLKETYPGNPAIGYVPAYRFRMVNTGKDETIGNIDFRVGNTFDLIMYGGHIGYEVAPDYRGHGYAARACRLLFPLAKEHGLKELWITCNPDNIPSRKTCERLGGTLVEIVDLPAHNDMYKIGERQKCRYRVDLFNNYSGEQQ